MSSSESDYSSDDNSNSQNSDAENNEDFDVDFEEIRRRRQRAKEAAERAALEAEIAAEEKDEVVEEETPQKKGAARSGVQTNMATAMAANKLKNLRNRKKAQQEAAAVEEERVKPTHQYHGVEFTAGNKTLTQWPFDHYHLVQKLFYEKAGHAPKKFLLSKNVPKKDTGNTYSIPVFARPSDPPDITSEVSGLSWTEFDKKAGERAISVVSTWLFDAGLIEELITKGGLPADGELADASDKLTASLLGNPIEGDTKLDREVNKLRESTKRQLSLIDGRLNDGVAASGREVTELVNAVIATKDDLRRLGNLSSYMTDSGGVDGNGNFMLSKYPHLKQAINARRNLARCFREVDFFGQIPSTCARLTEELHAGEWTQFEWTNVRSVCREHVELEIFLVEAEAGATKTLDSRRSSLSRQNFQDVGLPSNVQDVNRFLGDHLKTVRDLGDEIRAKIMSGMKSAFDTAMNNPAGMVALVEAVEVYETAYKEYRTIHGEEESRKSDASLRFTNMRALALKELYQCMETFCDHQMSVDEEENAENPEEAFSKRFSAVLRAAHELTAKSFDVKTYMTPRFPPEWEIETLWSTNVAFTCSKQILSQLGGIECHKISELSVLQLLDLVAWVENFRETIEDSFPTIWKKSPKGEYYIEGLPYMISDDGNVFEIDIARDVLIWSNRMLWEVHAQAKGEFLYHTKDQTEEWFENVYKADHTHHQGADGKLVTSLCEDVYGLATVQLKTVRERLTKKSDVLVQAVRVIFDNLKNKQEKYRDQFLNDFESCCAAANDFIRMSEKCDDLLMDFRSELELSKNAQDKLDESSSALLGLYGSDARYAGQKINIFIFADVEAAIANDLFGKEWLDEADDNAYSTTMVTTIDDYMQDLESCLDDVNFLKTMEALVTASILFYLKTLIKKSGTHKSNKNSFFADVEKALAVMTDDMMVLRHFFEAATEHFPQLSRLQVTIKKQFHIFDAFHEMMAISAGLTESDLGDCIIEVQKTTRNVQLTKLLVGDIWHLMNPGEEKQIYDRIDGIMNDLRDEVPDDEKAVKNVRNRSCVPGVRFDQVMARTIDEMKRSRPMKKDGNQAAEAVLSKWRTTWS